uniref:Myb/SANT-like DNA-binding domain-containing protein n=1 Tax=Anguilla anguilla TaxID=7936 RepID=A0A0E9W8N5_ANGAN
MPKQKSKNGGAPDSKRKKNLSSSEVEVLLREVNSKRPVIFSRVSSGYRITQKRCMGCYYSFSERCIRRRAHN